MGRHPVLWVVMLGLVGVACGGADPTVADPVSDGDVTAVAADPVAELTVLDDGAERRSAAADAFVAAVTGDALGVADLLRTDATGFVQIDYADGSLTRLDADTEFEIVALGGDADVPDTRARLEVGRTWNRVESVASGTGRFEIETSVAVAAVRGTAFVVQCLPDGTCVFIVVDGVVTVTVGDREYELRAGQRLVVGPDGEVDGPEDVGVETLREDPWIARNLEEDGDEAAVPPDGGDDGTTSTGPADATDPEGDISVPAVDVIATRSGVLPDGRPWVLLEMAGQWPPSDELFSWYVELQGFDADGNAVNSTSTQYHDGVRTPAQEPVEEVAVDGGLLFIVPGPAPDVEIRYAWLTRVWPSEPEPVEEDTSVETVPWRFDNVEDPRDAA